MPRGAHGGRLGRAAALRGASGLAIDASANLNPLGPPAWLDAAFNEGRRAALAYPDPDYAELRAAAGAGLRLDPDRIVFGAGADELMFALARASGKALALIEEPCYSAYREASEDAGLRVLAVRAALPGPAPGRRDDGADSSSGRTAADGGPADGRDGADDPGAGAEAAFERYAALLSAKPEALLWLAAPNNPTGLVPEGYPELPARLARAFPRALIAVDEAFVDFVDGLDPRGCLDEAARLPNLVAFRSMTKFWCVPGLRLGYAVAGGELAQRLRAALPTWPLNCVAEAFARRGFADPGAAARRDETRALVAAERARMAELLSGLPGIQALEARANFYLIRVDEAAAGISAGELASRAEAAGVGLRRCDSFDGFVAPGHGRTGGGEAYLRVAIRRPEENDGIIAAIARIVGEALGGGRERSLYGWPDVAPSPAAARRPAVSRTAGSSPASARRARALMVLGTSSGAGKSLITTALCRIFRDLGVDVAPYKAQNMANNSAVTADGLELGRAQAVQAAACGLEPDVRMNPVLLKPEGDRCSQVVMMGRPYARLEAADYYRLKGEMRAAARSAYDSLAAEHELVVMEGAGSPAEINLKANDFVNLAAARYAGARALLVGDIDRGGVFASFIGTISTFSPEELRLFGGFVVNKFRGDPALLGDAFAMVEDRTGFPTLGCVPMLSGLDIPDEDEPVVKAGSRPGAELRIAVPALRRVSNFTDLDAFAAEPDVAVEPVASGRELREGRWDALVIPGSKATVADLAWLRSVGLADAIVDFAAAGGTVVGICGGYQMLGRRILDPDRIEADTVETPGLGLLPLVTAFASDKRLARRVARWVEGGFILEGYEIHHGRTLPEAEGLKAVILGESGEALGYGKGRVWGSYLHGLFDADAFRRHFLNGLRAERGFKPLPIHERPSLDSRIGILADAVREAVDMRAIRALAGL
jgi:cobyric acid synthase CobQ